MQTTSAIPVTAMRPAKGYASEIMSGAVTAVQEPKSASPDRTTIKLSHEAMDRYISDQSEAAVKNDESESPVRQPGEKTAEKADSRESDDGTDMVAETLERLQEMLKEAQERLRVAQQQMTQAMAEMKGAGDESQRVVAMMKVQAAQMLVISAQGEVLQIHAQINKILEEQQKSSKGGASVG